MMINPMTKILNERFVIRRFDMYLAEDGTFVSNPLDALLFYTEEKAIACMKRWCEDIDFNWDLISIQVEHSPRYANCNLYA